MRLVVTLAAHEARDRDAVGGKGAALAALAGDGFTVPRTLCVTTAAYRRYLDETGLGERLPMILGRKEFSDMRWEELWDTSLRIRSLFLATPLPRGLRDELSAELAPFAPLPAVVRSSAPAEDAAGASFAGLFESFVNVRGIDAILHHLRLVWASLWSDRALLYRQELGLDPATSVMGVVVQELVAGERSGVVFGKSPDNPALAVIEAVWGLNQGLVDGTVEPDRWAVHRENGELVTHYSPERSSWLVPSPRGVTLLPLPPERAATPPLGEPDVAAVFRLALRGEDLFGLPQDMEWTIEGGSLFTLQARPVTTLAGDGDDLRPWYLSLRRSFSTLTELRRSIEEELLPAMEAEGARFDAMDLTALDDDDLAAAIRERRASRQKWEDAYRRDCIPMAHGIRLFGQAYADRLQPADPFEFVELLAGADMLALARNRALEDLADLVRATPGLALPLREGRIPDDPAVGDAFARFTARHGDLTWIAGPGPEEGSPLAPLVAELAQRPRRVEASTPERSAALAERFIASFPEDEHPFARQLLELGRAAYRLRDNDNIVLGQIDTALHAAEEEARRRLDERVAPRLEELGLSGPGRLRKRVNPALPAADETGGYAGYRFRVRQLVGQPAGRGIARGPARVIRMPDDLRAFRAGEVLVCDAVDPNMTFVVPLAAAIVERRGGMLIHGAIIAREYGIPCVTGIPGAVERIATGDLITVDGHLGIVTVATPP